MSQSQSAFAIQPVNLNAIPRKAEGSKAVLITQRWNDPALAGGISATYNLLSQYQSGQFTDIQAVWIDNSTNYNAVSLTSIETGQVIRCPGLSQGMYPVASAAAPIFTLSILSGVFQGPTSQTTRLMLFNTPQRYFQNAGGAAYQSLNRVGGNIGLLPVTWLSTSIFGANQYFCLTGFQLSLSDAAGAYGGTFSIEVFLFQNGNVIFADQFQVTTATVAGILVYSKAINFAARTAPQTTADVWTIGVTAPPAGGTLQFDLVYYFDILNLQ